MDIFSKKHIATLTTHFIVGTGRSGTTLLTQIFNANACVLAVPETSAFLRYKIYSHESKEKDWTESMADDIENYHKWRNSFNYKKLPWLFDGISLANYLKTHKPNYSYAQFLTAFYLCFHVRTRNSDNFSVQTIIDKEPRNSFYVKEIAHFFPNAKFIVLIRDYRAVLNSHKQSPDAFYNPIKHLSRWRFIYVQLTKFAQEYPDKIIWVHYEDLTKNPDNIVKKICRELNIDYNSSMIVPHEQESMKIVNTNEANVDIRDKTKWEALQKPINTNRSQKWKVELSQREIIIADLICGKLGLQYNYNTIEQFSISQKVKAILWYTPFFIIALPFLVFPKTILKHQQLFRWFLKFKAKQYAFKNK